MKVSPAGSHTRLDLQDRVAARPVEALQDNIRLVPKPGDKRCMKELILPPPSRSSRMTILFAEHRREEPGQGVTEEPGQGGR
jgi:hypothetical protein